MGKWIEQPQASMQTGDTGETRAQRVFHCDLGQGIAEADRRGFVVGVTDIVNGRQVTLIHRNSRNIGGIEELTIEYVGPAGPPPPPRAKVAHKEGDEEWRFKSSADEVPAKDFIAADGTAFTQAWGYPDDDPLLNSKRVLEMKRWIKPPWVVGSKENPKALPNSKTRALEMLGLGTVPKVGYTLGGARTWLCTSVESDADGALIVVTAEYTEKVGGWVPEEAYPSG